MTPRRKILWLDNDRGLHKLHSEVLAAKGCDVNSMETAIEAEAALRDELYDLVILDVMIPTLSNDEEEIYSPQETELGHQTGLVFWRRNRELLTEQGVPVLVFTVRLDEGIQRAFRAAGLPEGNFSSKYELSTPKAFWNKIQSVMRPAAAAAGGSYE
ncbi:MAG: hypothetical protein M3O15_03390 [Acidobacteriota bacterium]|nr:hypothetical protein [Acidobacteriota bacterium]